ncbi:hypothetical protein OB919_21445 [Halobacteria archaeon AArc-curdl1]|uniref:Uncharacterized protein n=1 Tax=Natronosalvus hydrolyticus TaxID=2979988 RepID=A0AAP2ZDM4_9EURY|nr:hypothetical protein [Halobacteria archaeon AArc-curdl1]
MDSSVTVDSSLLAHTVRFSLYNSPYAAHNRGCAIDLYPGTLADGRTTVAPSPVSGTVLETRTVRAPAKPYAPEHDHLVLLSCDGPQPVAGLVARILHVDPDVEPGEYVDAGDSLGTLVRAGFFAPWVDNHLHVGFRTPDQNHHRASGSLELSLGLDVTPLEWDGTGTVIETGDTYAVLDAPIHPAPGTAFVGIAAKRHGGAETGTAGQIETTTAGQSETSAGETMAATAGVLDGGLPHYEGGGFLECGTKKSSDRTEGHAARDTVSLLGTNLGSVDGRTITWGDVTVTANGTPITGLSCFCARDGGFGAKLICPDHDLERGTRVCVGIDTEEHQEKI